MTSSAVIPWRGLLGHMSLGQLSDFALGCSPDPEEGRTPGRSTAWLQLLRIVLLGKSPEQGHASGSNELSASSVNPTLGLFLALVKHGEEKPA